MSKPSDILTDLTLAILESRSDFEREKKGELNQSKLDKEFETAKGKALESIAALAKEPGQKSEDTAREEIENLLDTARVIYTKVGVEYGTKLAQQKLKEAQEKKLQQTPQPHKPAEPAQAPKPQEAETPPPNKESIVKYWNKLGTESSNGIYERIGQRATLQWLGGYLLREGEPRQFIKKSYEERRDEARGKVEKAINGLPDRNAINTMDEAVNAYGSVVEEISFTLGMQVGARINTQLLGALDRDYC